MKKENFTLLELLIVIAVIAILLSILLPSLGNARYKAKLAVCKSNLAQICRINLVYSNNNDQFFPDRKAANYYSFGAPHVVSHNGPGKDDRQMWLDMGYWDFGCPLSYDKKPFNYEPSHPEPRVLYSYSVFYGWKVNNDLNYKNRYKAMIYRGEEVDIAASDILHVRRRKGYSLTSHEGKYQGGLMTNTKIFAVKPYTDFAQDMNIARQDGSVFMIDKVKHLDNRMKKLPYEQGGESQRNLDQDYIYVPKTQFK